MKQFLTTSNLGRTAFSGMHLAMHSKRRRTRSKKGKRSNRTNHLNPLICSGEEANLLLWYCFLEFLHNTQMTKWTWWPLNSRLIGKIEVLVRRIEPAVRIQPAVSIRPAVRIQPTVSIRPAVILTDGFSNAFSVQDSFSPNYSDRNNTERRKVPEDRLALRWRTRVWRGP